MAEYKGSIELISGIKPKNNGNFPLVNAKDVQVDANGKRLDEKLAELGNTALHYSYEQNVISEDGFVYLDRATCSSDDIAQGEFIIYSGGLCRQYEITETGYKCQVLVEFASGGGESGESGEDGKDYVLSDSDKSEIVQMILTELGGKPVYGYVDAENTIVVQGSLADGTYSVKYEMADGSTVDIGNLVLGEDVHYSVTNNLTNCTIDNSATQVTPNGSYSATLTANSGYVLSTVKVTMGGTDITSSVYSNGVISISSVTGNVVITANAVKEAAKTYSVTNNLTNCVNSNSNTVVEEGTAYSATITAKDGYELTSVTATMGGSAVTVTNGVINIASVTGDIVITATASVNLKNWITNSQNADGSLFVGTNGEAGYKSNTRLGTSDGGERPNATGIELTGFIPVTASDTLYFKGVTITTSSDETTCWYDSDHNFISGGGSSTNTMFGTMDGSVKSVKISDIKSGAPANNGSKIAYVRISASEINANSIITKNQPIE